RDFHVTGVQTCALPICRRYGSGPKQRIWKRLDDELEIIRGLGFASYFLTVADVTDLVRDLGIRTAARGSGAGSLVNYLLGISGRSEERRVGKECRYRWA